MVRLQEMKQGKYRQFMMTVPSKLVRAKGWKGGQELEIILDGKGDLKIVEKTIKINYNQS